MQRLAAASAADGVPLGGLAGMEVDRGKGKHGEMMTEYRLRLLTVCVWDGMGIEGFLQGGCLGSQ